MALDSLTFATTSSQNWTARKNVTGLPQGNQNVNQPSSAASYGTGAANAALTGGVAGADELYYSLQTITGAGNLSLDLTALTDILAQAGITLARFKFIRVKLIGSTEAAPDGTAGTAASSVTIGNAGGTGTNGNVLWMGASTHTTVLDGGAVGEYIEFGSPTAAGRAVDGTHKLLYVLNNDAVVSAKVLITIAGGSN